LAVLLAHEAEKGTAAMSDPVEKAQIIKLAEGLYVRQAVDNMGWIDMGEYAIVVDALEQVSLEGEVLDSIELTLGDKPVRYVINTHTHYDHVALNEAFQRKFSSEIINARTCSLPQDGREFTGNRKVRVFPSPGCHTNEDYCIWCCDDGVLFVGDIFGWGLIPLTRALNDKSAELLIATYERLAELDADTVVPGHGTICGTAELVRWVKYFRWLLKEVALHSQGKSGPVRPEKIALPEDMIGWWRFEQWKHADSVRRVIAAVEKGRLTI